MAKINISDKIFAFVPITTQTILGTHVNDKANFMALGWLTRCNFKPPMVAIAVNKSNQSCNGILDNAQFSVNVPSTDIVGITDYTGLVSARKTDKSGLFEVFYGELKAAPLIAECPFNVECRLYEKVELPTNYVFVGEVVGVYSDESILQTGFLLCDGPGCPSPGAVADFEADVPCRRREPEHSGGLAGAGHFCRDR